MVKVYKTFPGENIPSIGFVVSTDISEDNLPALRIEIGDDKYIELKTEHVKALYRFMSFAYGDELDG